MKSLDGVTVAEGGALGEFGVDGRGCACCVDADGVGAVGAGIALSTMGAVSMAALVGPGGPGGGMSRSAPVVASTRGAVVPVLGRVVGAVVVDGDNSTDADTKAPPIAMTKSKTPHGNHAGNLRRGSGMIAVGRSRRARSAVEGFRSGFERPFSRW